MPVIFMDDLGLSIENHACPDLLRKLEKHNGQMHLFSKKNEAIDHPDERDMESGLVLHSISKYNRHPWLTSRDFAFL